MDPKVIWLSVDCYPVQQGTRVSILEVPVTRYLMLEYCRYVFLLIGIGVASLLAGYNRGNNAATAV